MQLIRSEAQSIQRETLMQPITNTLNLAALRTYLPAAGAALLCCSSLFASEQSATSKTAAAQSARISATHSSALSSARPGTAVETDGRAVFLSPFLPSSKPSLSVQGVIEVDFLPELVDMIPSQSAFDLVQFPLPDGRMVDMWLSEFKVTTESTTIAVMEAGPNGEPVANYGYTPEVRTFRGHITGIDGSLVFLAFSPTAISGFINIEGQMLSISNGPRGEMPLMITDLDNMPEGAINWLEYSCQVRAGGPEGSVGDGGVAELATCLKLEMAFETDNAFRGLFGSSAAAVNYATQIAAGMNTIYYEEQLLYPVMTFLRVWDTGVNDPWTAPSFPDQLTQFANAWGGGGGPVGSNPRDLAHFLSGNDWGGGVAYLNAVCDPNIGFAVSSSLSGFFPYPLQNNNGQNWDIVVTTHEMGHNCGCNHTHDLGVDSCTSPGGCISNGTIMSYCHLCPGGLANITLEFAGANKTQMDVFLTPLGCLSADCPVFDPSSFEASDGSFVDAVQLTWVPPAQAPLRYEIQRRIVGAPAWSDLDLNVASGVSLYSDFSAVAGTVYEYRIRTVLTATGLPSDVWVGPNEGFKGVVGPLAFAASDGTFSNRVALTWQEPISGAPDLYIVYRGTATTTPLKIDEVPSTLLSYDDDGTYDNPDPAWDGGTPPETTPGAVYFYEVRALYGAVESAPSTDTGFRSTPGPFNLLATGSINGTTPPLSDRVRLSWNLPGSVNGVYVYRSTAGGDYVQVAYLVGNQSRWSDLQALPDLAYNYKVVSFSNFLGLSAPSEPDLGFVLPPPSMTAATDGTFTDRVRLTWTKPATWNPNGYNVWRKRSGRDPWPSSPIATNLSASTLTFDDTTAEPGAVYVYAVAGRSAQFNSYSDRGSPNTGYAVVQPPTGVAASDGTFPGFVQITWTPTGATTQVSWEVWRRVAGSTAAFTKIRTVTSPSHLDSTAQIGVVYEYHIRTRATNGVVSVPSISDTGFR
jgi:hypothetical protein